mgnify:CR=1 FL=1|jgi:hypothetical protein
MKKRLLIISLVTSFALTMPVARAASNAEPALLEQVQEDITISVSGQTVLINGAQGKTLEVISLTGRQVLTVKIDSPSQRIELNVPKGCYILKIGKVARKVAIR